MQKKINYTRVGIIAAISFLVIVILVEFLFSLSTKESTQNIISEMLTTKYIISKLLVAIVYGFLMVYLVKRKQKKLLKK